MGRLSFCVRTEIPLDTTTLLIVILLILILFGGGYYGRVWSRMVAYGRVWSRMVAVVGGSFAIARTMPLALIIASMEKEAGDAERMEPRCYHGPSEQVRTPGVRCAKGPPSSAGERGPRPSVIDTRWRELLAEIKKRGRCGSQLSPRALGFRGSLTLGQPPSSAVQVVLCQDSARASSPRQCACFNSGTI
jgi:hypothetical protein